MRSYGEICNFFGVQKIGEICFAHAVNSQSLLKRYLDDPRIHILEGDISVSAAGEIILAHPPAKTSDLKFTDWLNQAAENRKGVKLDFKVPEAVELCLKELKSIGTGPLPIFLNVDILKGPGDGPPLFDVHRFIKTCLEHLPNAVLSLGWKTERVEGESYTEENIYEALKLVESCPNLITFPIRIFYIRNSWENLVRLLEKPEHSLTLWNNELIEPKILSWVQENTNPERTFYDLVHLDGSPLSI